ncbi:MAG TPA: divergent polysaccharide deacetylase family protein [Patescibacteria group bacterium]|nr:divergent polysaccharide deacetylase family protein [Patescibacteria group bacterium]
MKPFLKILFLAMVLTATAHAQDLPAWKKNAVAVTIPVHAAKIVIIIDDMGEDRVHTKQITELPGPLTLSYLPYPEHVAEEVAAGRKAGHEIMVHMPMEPMHADLETGDYFLTTEEPADEFMAHLNKNLAAFDGYVGVNNHMGSRLTTDRKSMDMVMAELHTRGLLFVDSRTVSASVAAESAAAHGLPQISRDVFLDDVPTIDAVRHQLSEVERVARRQGHAVAIGHPKAATIDALKEWLPTLKDKGFVLVPVSAVVNTGS